MSDTCEFCGSPLRAGPGKGRPRKYCGDPCRQAAHRRRLSAGATAASTAQLTQTEPQPAVEQQSAPRSASAVRAAGYGPCAGDELLAEIARDIQDGARDLARLLPSLDGQEPLRRVVQLQEQLDGLTAAVVGRARYRRVTWHAVSSTLGISEDTARHRYTDRYVLRRLARFNRSETAPTSLAALFSAPVGGVHDGAGDAGGESGDTAGDRGGGEGPDQQTSPAESSGAAYNRLSPILSMLIRTAQVTNKDVSSRIGCSASYLSRILSGERVPTWELTRKFAQACGADPEVLRAVWESEKLRHKSGVRACVPEAPGLSAAERLRAAIHTLHLRAGRPTPVDVAVASRWVLTAGTVASLLDATVLPPPGVLHTFVQLLGGDTDHFHQLLHAAQHEAAPDTALQPPPTCPAAMPTAVTTPADGAIAQPITPAPNSIAGPDAVMKTFSEVLTEDRTVEDGRARLLHKHAQQTHPTSPHRRLTLSAITQALRHRTLLPPATITPLKST